MFIIREISVCIQPTIMLAIACLMCLLAYVKLYTDSFIP